MTVVRFKNRPNGNVAFNNLLSDLFPQTPSLYQQDLRQAVPVNIRENEKTIFARRSSTWFAERRF